VTRGERPIKLGDSWFSSKCIEVQGYMFRYGGRALFGLGALPGYQTQANSEYRIVKYSTEPMGDNLHGREGHNPDRRLRFPSLR
jgi:hypothetical protein